LALFCVVSLSGQAQVVINEYSASNTNSYTDYQGDFEDWFELYNPTASAVDLTGYFLSDRASNPMKSMIPAGTSIPANGYLIVFASGKDIFTSGELHTNFKLTQTKPEDIILANTAGTPIDGVTMSASKIGHSNGRITDGDPTWGVFTFPTPGSANTGALTGYANKPQFSMAPGHYTATLSVNVTSADPNVTLHYTTDGTAPNAGSPTVSGGINVSSTTVIKAIAISSDPNVLNSFIETNTYLINENHTVYVMSISGDEVDDLLNDTQWGIEPPGVFELFAPDGTFLTEASGEFNKHGNDSWFYDQRGFDFIARDQWGINYSLEHQIFRVSTRDEFQRVIVKAAANDNISFEDGAHIRDSYVHSLSQIGDLKLNERSHESAILYLNGQYWGVYDIREKVDDLDYLEYYFDQGEGDVQFLKTWGGTWQEYGGAQAQSDWDALANFILTNDMTIQANWDYVDSLYNWQSLVDYVCLNSYIVCADWLNWNTAWWRGLNQNGDKKRWRYALWDMDASFGHYINYTGIPTQAADADPCDPESLSDPGGQGHVPILNKLMDNATFNQYYISRYIDLGNTVFSCDYMNAHLDSLINIIQPEMQRQVNTWGGTMAQWQQNVQDLRDFIDDRCVQIQTGMVGCYNLSGPYDVTVQVDPPLSGWVKMNSLDVYNFDYTGDYYGGIDILMDAKANTGFFFDYWSSNSHTFSPHEDSTDIALMLTSGDTIVAHFRTDTTVTPIDTTTPPVVVIGEYVLEIPNAFSPNGDGQNDMLNMIASNYEQLELSVYDRWGQKVFFSTDISIGWDGTFEGKDVNSGVYVYKLKALFDNGKLATKTGNITLMR